GQPGGPASVAVVSAVLCLEGGPGHGYTVSGPGAGSGDPGQRRGPGGARGAGWPGGPGGEDPAGAFREAVGGREGRAVPADGCEVYHGRGVALGRRSCAGLGRRGGGTSTMEGEKRGEPAGRARGSATLQDGLESQAR